MTTNELLEEIRRYYPGASLLNVNTFKLAARADKVVETIRKLEQTDPFDIVILTRRKDRGGCRMRSYSPNDAYLFLRDDQSFVTNGAIRKVCYLPFSSVSPSGRNCRASCSACRPTCHHPVSPFQYYLIAVLAGLLIVFLARLCQRFITTGDRVETNDTKDEKG